MSMKDPTNWQAGDVVEYVGPGDKDMTKGKHYTLIASQLTGRAVDAWGDAFVEDDNGTFRVCISADKFKWVSGTSQRRNHSPNIYYVLVQDANGIGTIWAGQVCHATDDVTLISEEACAACAEERETEPHLLHCMAIATTPFDFIHFDDSHLE